MAKATAGRPRLIEADEALDGDTNYVQEAPHHWNAAAIAALPMAITTVFLGLSMASTLILLLGGAVAFTLGLVGSRQCRDRGDRGKGFAIAGMAIGAAAFFLGLIALLLAI